MKLLPTVAGFVVAAALAAPSQAIQIVYTASLSGANEVPPNASPGSGDASVMYDSLAHTLTVSYSFADLGSGLVDGHIHCCTTPDNNVGVAVGFTGLPLGATAGSDDSEVYDLTSSATFRQSFIDGFAGGVAADAEAALVAGLNSGLTYFNLHSELIPSGEIRGQLAATTVPIPEPRIAAMLLLGLGVLGLVSRRSRRGGDGGSAS
ncbi:CHRD domain-containing protein [Methylibium sp.]|uniref:CHRD domain-containing protein n=1 Tax=Methylibium sp. TaxID=2067992 RepID=UPI00184B738B|nr:CHRD domain-containing protein [Methylibium sp.]MBA3590136.1 CHRD domain-containing protein [Methylibium sp.]